MITREDFLKGFMRADLKGFKEAIEKAKKSIKELKIEERDIFNKPVIYFQFSKSPGNNTALKLKIYDEDIGLQEIGNIEVLEYTIEGEYRDIDPSDIAKIDEFLKTVCEYTSEKVIYLFFSVKKIVINLDDECLLVY
jgi:hypothetical protein